MLLESGSVWQELRSEYKRQERKWGRSLFITRLPKREPDNMQTCAAKPPKTELNESCSTHTTWTVDGSHLLVLPQVSQHKFSLTFNLQKIQKLQQQFNHDASILHSSNTNFFPFIIVFETEFHLNSQRYAYFAFQVLAFKHVKKSLIAYLNYSQFVQV